MEHKRRKIEREFGVPIGGEILEPQFWTRTAIKDLPKEGPLPLKEIFGREAPLIVDAGCGNGRFLIGQAVWNPGTDYLGADILPVVIRYATRRANQRGLTNLRFLVGDGIGFAQNLLPKGRVSQFHCYHPQPYHDPRRALERMINPRFLSLVHQSLVPGGEFFIQTDSQAYWKYIQGIIGKFFEFQERVGCWPDAPKGRTRREILALRRGFRVFRGKGIRRDALTPEDLSRLETTLPLPNFITEPEVQHLDRAEREE
ncbi:MAG: methyltransferase domain-containing protein [Gemmataceae bacterium]|nr:methyltransferase domain-containing protein [Gemmataceae bacterium]